MAKIGCFAVVLVLLSLVPASSAGPGEDETRSLINGVASLVTVAISTKKMNR